MWAVNSNYLVMLVFLAEKNDSNYVSVEWSEVVAMELISGVDFQRYFCNINKKWRK